MSGISPVARHAAHPQASGSEPATEVVPPHAEAKPAAPERPAMAAERPAMSRAEAEHTVTTLNRILNPLDLNLHIHYDDANHRYAFKIVDRRTNEVIREFPTPSVLEAARDAVAGMFVDQRG